MTTYYKVLRGLEACHGGTFTYDAPEGKRPGKWTPRINYIKVCNRGYHVVGEAHITDWLDRDGLVLWEVEAEGVVAHGDKYVCERIRLIRRVERVGNLLVVNDGEHEVTGYDICYAGGTAKITARDYSTVTAWGSSTVKSESKYAVIVRRRLGSKPVTLVGDGSL